MVEDCIFCKIASGLLGSLIFEDENLVAFRDINPAGPVHVLIVPKKHVANIVDAAEDEKLLGRMVSVAAMLAKKEGIAESGFRVVMNQGGDGGQSVGHFHMHLLGGRVFGWPPG